MASFSAHLSGRIYQKSGRLSVAWVPCFQPRHHGQRFQKAAIGASSTAQQFNGQISQSAPDGVSEDAISDLEPADIERLLERGRGATVDAYCDFIQTIADLAGITFEKALQVISDFERMPPDEFKALAESLVMLTAEAARYGVSAGELTKIILDYNDRELPPDAGSLRRRI